MLSTDNETLAYLSFSYAPGIGPVTFQSLINAFGSASKAYNSSVRCLQPYFRSEKQLKQFDVFRTSFSAHRTLSELNTLSIHYYTSKSLQQPVTTRTFSCPSIGFFTRGDISLLTSVAPSVAIVGSRKPTEYGRKTAQLFATDLARAGAIILSGLAIGIDSLAHSACIQAHGRTLAVLGTGHPTHTNLASLRLYRAIISSGGLVVSSYPPGYPVHKGSFPERNKVIAWLAKAVLLIEGAEHSGSRITAQHALAMDRDIYCIPGSIYSPQSQTPHHFIQQGAYLAHSPSMLIEALHLQSIPSLSPVEKACYDALIKNPFTAPEIATILHISLPQCVRILTQLEAQGVICKRPNGFFTLSS